MSLSEGLPRCPQDCGGRLGAMYPESLTPQQAQQRRLFGCDEPSKAPQYTITCPRCDGSRISSVDGEKCDHCSGGLMRIHRCPTSYVDQDISVALRHYEHAEAGIFPEPGGLLDQAPSFLHFCSVVGGEVARVQKEESDDRAAKQKAKSSAAKVRGKR